MIVAKFFLLALVCVLICAMDWRSSKGQMKTPETTDASCLQAWVGGGVGAWYRYDTLCNSSNYFASSITFCFPTMAGAYRGDALYQSLGVYNTKTGASAEVGLTSSGDDSWSTYANSAKGGLSGTITIHAQEHRCVDISVSLKEQNVTFAIGADGRFLGTEYFLYSQLDSDLFLNSSGKNIGFYLSQGISQRKPETLHSGSYMVDAQTSMWKVYDANGNHIVESQLIAPQNHGYTPGPCCSEAEKKTIDARGDPQLSSTTITFTPE